MKSSVLISSDNRRDYFWFPFHPIFRWPMRILGIVNMVLFIAEAVRGNGWRFGLILWGLMFFSTSLEKPYLRRKTRGDRIASLLVTMLLVAIFGVAWLVYLARF